MRNKLQGLSVPNDTKSAIRGSQRHFPPSLPFVVVNVTSKIDIETSGPSDNSFLNRYDEA